MRVRDEHLGKKVRCPNCQAVFATAAAEEPPLVEIVEDEEPFPERAPRTSPRDEDRPRRQRYAPEPHEHPEPDDYPQPGRSTPSSVIVAIVALCVLLALQLVIGILALAASRLFPEQLGRVLGQLIAVAVIGGLVLWGLFAGHRLAWQWGRLLGMLGAVLYLIAALAVLAAGGAQAGPPGARIFVGLFALIVSACLFTITFSLATKPAKAYFGLRCPACRRYTSSAADFWFNQAKCKSCGAIW